MAPREDFTEFVGARQAALLRTAYLLTGHRQDAEDLVQVALVRAVPHWSRINGDPEAYVRRIIAREHISRWRRRRWREVSTDVVPDSARGVVEHDDALDLRDAMASLAPRQRAVVVLRYYEDLTEVQTAEALGISVGTVKSQARDALARLRRALPDLPEPRPAPTGQPG